jgi:hypothetical protein
MPVAAPRPRPKAVLLVVLVAVLINLPAASGAWTRWQVDRSGRDVTARVTDHVVRPPADQPDYFVAFVFDEEIDPRRQTWTAEVDRATYDAAVAREEIGVRVLPGQPAAHRVEGQVTHRAGLFLTGAADLALLVVLLLAWRFRGRLRPQLKAVAVGDVEGCPPGVALERLEGDLYLIRGEVSSVEDDEIVLDLGERSVRVLLDGHLNPVADGQPAQVHGRLIG